MNRFERKCQKKCRTCKFGGFNQGCPGCLIMEVPGKFGRKKLVPSWNNYIPKNKSEEKDGEK